jgi:hypothetical protein
MNTAVVIPVGPGRLENHRRRSLEWHGSWSQ